MSKKNIAMTLKPNEIVLVLWEDAAGKSRWVERLEATDMTPARCETIGRVLKVDKKGLRIAGSHDDSGHVMDANVIPLANIEKVHKLRFVSERKPKGSKK